MTAGWFKKLTVAGPAVFKGTVSSTAAFTGGSMNAASMIATSNVQGRQVSASSSVIGNRGLREGGQLLNHSTGQAALNIWGLSILSAANNSTFTLGPPTAGLLKHLQLSTGTNTLVVKTTSAFVGTTCTKITRVASKASLLKIPPCVSLVGATGNKWAILSCDRSTALTLS